MGKKVGISISALALLLLGTTDGDISKILSFMLAVVFCACIWLEKDTIENIQLFKNKTIMICATVLSMANGIVFYIRWHDKSLAHRVFDKIGVSANMGTAACMLVGVLCAIPAIVWLIQWMSSKTGKISFDEKCNNFICYGITIIGILIQFVFCFGRGIWVDEAFTLAMIRHNYVDMVNLTAADVHPPLYYILLKAWTDFWKLFFDGSVITVFTKIFSVFPGIILLVVAMKKIKKQWGSFVASAWIFATVSVSYLISNGVEIRMYSWALLFVTLSLLFMNDIVETNKKTAWCAFVLSSLAAAYTHYYACIGVAVVYGMIFIWAVWKNRKLLVPWIVASIATVIGYLPWLFVFLKQAQNVSDNYWINGITTRTLVSYLAYMFDNNFFFIFVVILVGMVIGKKQLQEFSMFYGVSAVCVPLGVVAVGVAASILIRPVFVIRYVIPAMACLWFGIVLLVDKLKLENVKAMLVLFVSCMFICYTGLFVKEESKEWKETTKIYDLVGNTKESVFISDNYHVQNNVQALMETSSLLWNRNEDELDERNDILLKDVFQELGQVDNKEQLQSVLEKSDTVYFISKENETDMTKFSEDNDVIVEDLGKYYMEYEVEIYKLCLK
ncbi:MAG: hypothetical protein K5895_00020 [Lachnospiraceae bacterium]|nr:hypothetical protein [Lachnospiraceae bacterium]